MSTFEMKGHMTVREALEAHGVKLPVLSHPAHGLDDWSVVTDADRTVLFSVPETLGRNREDARTIALIIASLITYFVGPTYSNTKSKGGQADG